MSDLTTERQHTESEAKIQAVRKSGEYRDCFICKKPILPGQSYYVITNQIWQKRHTTCARHPTQVIPGGGKAGSYHGTGGRVIRGTNSM